MFPDALDKRSSSASTQTSETERLATPLNWLRVTGVRQQYRPGPSETDEFLTTGSVTLSPSRLNPPQARNASHLLGSCAVTSR
jgi:hypothetical protein